MVKSKSSKSVGKNSAAKPAPVKARPVLKKDKAAKPAAAAVPPVNGAAPGGKHAHHAPAVPHGAAGKHKDKDSKEPAAPISLGNEVIKSQAGVDLTEKIKELIRLAQEQGYLTHS